MARPKLKFDLEQVKLLGRFRATYQTMADWFECSYKTIERKMGDENSEFCRAYKKALATTKMTLAESQLKYALEGNASLLIWLGKNLLDQTDQKEKTKEEESLAELANVLKDNFTTK